MARGGGVAVRSAQGAGLWQRGARQREWRLDESIWRVAEQSRAEHSILSRDVTDQKALTRWPVRWQERLVEAMDADGDGVIDEGVAI